MLKTVEKIQVALLKNQMKREAGKRFDNVIFSTDGDFVYVCIAGHRLHRIHHSFWFLNLETLAPPNKTALNVWEETKKHCIEPAHYTGVTRQAGVPVLEFKTSDGKTSYFNEKYVKEFGKPEELTFLVDPDKERNSFAIPQNENGYEMGIICPVNVKEA